MAFAVMGVVALIFGWNVYIDIGGAGLLFVIGGILGLIVMAIYNSGKRAASNDIQSEVREAPPWLQDYEDDSSKR